MKFDLLEILKKNILILKDLLKDYKEGNLVTKQELPRRSNSVSF